MHFPQIRGCRILQASLLSCLLASSAARADIEIVFDAPTINQLLTAVTAHDLVVPIAGGQTVKVVLDELKVLGFEPDPAGSGHILTSLKLSVPQFELKLAAQPRLSLHVVDGRSGSVLELRFSNIPLPLGFAKIDLAPFVPPVRYPADSAFRLAGANGDVEVQSRLSGVTMTREFIRFRVSLDVMPPAPP
jgi:hypothetical protein